MTLLILIAWLLATAGLAWGLRRVTKRRPGWTWPTCLVIAAAVMLAVGFASLAIWQHHQFETHGHDLGLFDQGLWRLSRFETPANTIRQTPVSNFFGDHFHPILFALVPFYWIFNSPLVLVVAQAFLLASVVPLGYWLTRVLQFKPWPAALLAVVFGLQPGWLLAVRFDFHDVAFAPPLILLTFIMALAKRWRWYAISLVALLMVKESLAPTVALIGLALILLRRWRAGAFTLVAGVAWLLIVTQLIIPSLAENQAYPYWIQYKKFGNGPGEIFANFIQHPVPFIQAFFDHPEKINTLRSLLGPLAWLPVISWPTWPLLAFGFAERFWTDNLGLWKFQFHYQLVLTSALIVASLFGINLLRRWFKWSDRWIMVLAGGLMALTLVTHQQADTLAGLRDQSIRQRPTVAWQAGLRRLPAQAKISAQDAFVPHLSQRAIIYQFPRVRDAEYIVLDPRAPGWPLTGDEIRGWQNKLTISPDWATVLRSADFTIFHRLNENPFDNRRPDWT